MATREKRREECDEQYQRGTWWIYWHSTLFWVAMIKIRQPLDVNLILSYGITRLPCLHTKKWIISFHRDKKWALLPAYWNCSYETFNCYFIGLFGSIKRIRKRGNFFKIHFKLHWYPWAISFSKNYLCRTKISSNSSLIWFWENGEGEHRNKKNTSVQKVYLKILFQTITRNVRGISLCIFSCFSLFKLIPTTSSRRICTIKLLIEFATGAAIHHRDEFPSLLKA